MSNKLTTIEGQTTYHSTNIIIIEHSLLLLFTWGYVICAPHLFSLDENYCTSLAGLSITEHLFSKIFGVPVECVRPLCVHTLTLRLALCVLLAVVGRPSEFPGGSYGNHGQSLPIPVPTQLQNYQRMEQNLHSTKQDGSPRFVFTNTHIHMFRLLHMYDYISWLDCSTCELKSWTMLLLGCRHQCVDAAVEACWASLGPGLHRPTGREQSPPIADFHWEVPDPSSSPLKVAQAPICFVYHTAKVFSEYLSEMSIRCRAYTFFFKSVIQVIWNSILRLFCKWFSNK